MADGRVSLYLDYYVDKQRVVECLGMYLVPEVDRKSKKINQATLEAVEMIKANKTIMMVQEKAGIARSQDNFIEYFDSYAKRQLQAVSFSCAN